METPAQPRSVMLIQERPRFGGAFLLGSEAVESLEDHDHDEDDDENGDECSHISVLPAPP